MFLLNWLPYIASSIYQMHIKDANTLSPFTATLSAVYAKTFLVWTPLFYIIFNAKIKKIVMEKLGLGLKEETGPLLIISQSKLQATTTTKTQIDSKDYKSRVLTN
jgi:hypothetical protein